MFLSNIYSHPDRLLHSHLENVADSCIQKFDEANSNLTLFFSKEHWRKLIWLMGFTHDIGKATKNFQEYLMEPDEKTKMQLKGDPCTNHSLISAVIAFKIAKKCVEKVKIDDEKKEIDDELFAMMPFLLFLAIKKHHGNINNATSLYSDEKDELNVPTSHLDTQIRAINQQELDFLFSFIADKLSIPISTRDLPESLVEYYDKFIRKKIKKDFKKFNKRTDYYLIFQFLYSLLLSSDKEDAIFHGEYNPQRQNIDSEIVKKFKSSEFGLPDNEMDFIREDIFSETDRSISELSLSKKIFSLNVPTGTGKTLTALSAALNLRNRLKGHGVTSRIIYALPFTSIIDQNYNVFEQILNTPENNVLMKHHHLSEISYKDQENEFEPAESKFLIESWESEIIVTTFFQIFHTLLTNRNRMVQKFYKFAGSIVLLDEIQSMPYKYWELVREIILKLSELFNTYFILITATQPEIFESNEIFDLVPHKQDYFEKLDRVDIRFETSPVLIDDFVELTKKEVIDSDESYLFVMNTINSSIELFNGLKETALNEKYFYYLSTGIIPKHRLQRIKSIKREKGRKIIVSTQLIEAGVDIDIENVWRDFAPLESINQVCGRCNRNSGSHKGKVRIFQLLNNDRNSTPFSKYIYGKAALSLIETKESLGDKVKISESDFLKNMSMYYKAIKERLSQDESEKNIAFMKNLQFADIYKSFKLIEDENYERKDVFIEYDDVAKDIWSSYLNLKKISNFIDRKNEFLKIKKPFYDYVISVPSKYVTEREYENTSFVYIKNELADQYYAQDIGWIRTCDNFQSYFF